MFLWCQSFTTELISLLWILWLLGNSDLCQSCLNSVYCFNIFSYRTFSQQCYNIEDLILRDCLKITNKTCEYLSTAATRLVKLDIDSCHKITDEGLKKVGYVRKVFLIYFTFLQSNQKFAINYLSIYLSIYLPTCLLFISLSICIIYIRRCKTTKI